MNQFYLGTSILGILLILGAILLIMMDKKKSLDYALRVEEEKNELIKVVADSEQMLEELNRFSDYVINQVEKKSSQLEALLHQCDETLSKPVAEVQRVNSVEVKEAVAPAAPDQMMGSEQRKSEAQNNRHKEVLELIEKGMSDAEIAKALNMGKGEVQLILGMNIHKLKATI